MKEKVYCFNNNTLHVEYFFCDGQFSSSNQLKIVAYSDDGKASVHKIYIPRSFNKQQVMAKLQTLHDLGQVPSADTLANAFRRIYVDYKILSRSLSKSVFVERVIETGRFESHDSVEIRVDINRANEDIVDGLKKAFNENNEATKRQLMHHINQVDIHLITPELKFNSIDIVSSDAQYYLLLDMTIYFQGRQLIALKLPSHQVGNQFIRQVKKFIHLHYNKDISEIAIGLGLPGFSYSMSLGEGHYRIKIVDIKKHGRFDYFENTKPIYLSKNIEWEQMKAMVSRGVCNKKTFDYKTLNQSINEYLEVNESPSKA